MRGTIVETVIEHGFHMSEINLGEVLRKGFRFTNVYGADLINCFMGTEEHWTQEIAVPTNHLTIQIHFPEERPPKVIRCKTVEGTHYKFARTTARLVELYGRKSIVWEVDDPKEKQVFKVEWIW